MKKLNPLFLFVTLLALVVSGCEPPGDQPAANPAAAWVLSEGRWESYTTDAGLPSNRITALAVDAEGHLWVGTDRYGGRLDDGTWVDIVSIATFDIALDDEGRVWFLDGQGVEVYEQGALTTHGTYGDLSATGADAILVDSQDRIWVGLWGGIALSEGGQWRNIDTTDLFGTLVWDLAEEPSGAIWAVGEGGCARFDGTTWESMTPPDQPASLTMNCVASDPSGRVWLGGKQVGAWVWDGEGWTQYTSADGLAGDTVWAIALDGANRVWLGTSGGLSVFDGETWTTYTVEDGLAHNDVRALAIVDDGVWIGTWGGLSHLVFASGSE